MEKDRGRAIRWLSLSAKQNNAEAQFQLGILLLGPMLRSGQDGSQDGEDDNDDDDDGDDDPSPPNLIDHADGILSAKEAARQEELAADFRRGSSWLQQAADQGHAAATEICTRTGSMAGKSSTAASIAESAKGARGNHLAFAKVQSSNGSGSGALGDEWLAGLNISADGFLKKTPYVNAANKQKQKGKGKKQRRKGRT